MPADLEVHVSITIREQGFSGDRVTHGESRRVIPGTAGLDTDEKEMELDGQMVEIVEGVRKQVSTDLSAVAQARQQVRRETRTDDALGQGRH
jgi:hypothetical protein